MHSMTKMLIKILGGNIIKAMCFKRVITAKAQLNVTLKCAYI